VKGETPLMKAVALASLHCGQRLYDSCDPLELVTLLLDNGANVNAVDSDGRPVIAHATHKAVTRFLKSRGAKLKRWWRP